MADTFRPSTANPTGTRHPLPYTYLVRVQQPPPQPPLHPSPSNPRDNFLRAFAAGIAIILIVAVILFVVEYFILRPALPEFQVDTLQLVNISVAAPQSLSALWVVGFSVKNPNKKLTIVYENTESSIYYKDKLLSQARIHHFKVGTRSQTTVTTPFVTNSAVEEQVLNDMNGDLAHGSINFSVTVLGRIGFKTGVWRWKSYLSKVLCSNMAVGISSLSSSGDSGELVGGSKRCQVR